MKKQHIYKFLFAVALLLVLGFAIHLSIDAVRYDPIATSAPFYLHIIIDAAIYLLPATLVLIVACIAKNKWKNP